MFCRSLLLGLLVSISPAFAQAPNIQKGVELLEQERYAEALPLFEQARRAQPGNASIENVLGIIKSKLGRLEEANGHYEKAIRLNPKLEAPHKNMGFNHLQLKQYPAAEEQLKVARDVDPKDPFVHYYLGLLYLAISRDKEAVEELKPAGSLLENDPDNALQMVKACVRLNRIDEALGLLGILEGRSALSVAQEYDLAGLLSAQKQYLQAADRLRRAVAADPKSWAHRYSLAVALLQGKRADEAISLLESLASERPQDANILVLLGSAYEAGGKAPQALEAYRKAARTDPQNPDRYLDYSRLLMDLDRFDQAAQFVQQGLKSVRDTYPLEVRLGAAQMAGARYVEARQAFQRAIEAHPEIALAYVGLAQAYLMEELDEDAAQLLAGARQKLPPEFPLEYYCGLALSRLNRNEEAAAVFEKAVSLNANVAEAHYELGKVYVRMNRVAAARAELERVLELAPLHANAHYQLSRIYMRLGEEDKARKMALEARQLIQTLREEGLKAQRKRLEAVQAPGNQ